jgi:hypothetical protein
MLKTTAIVIGGGYLALAGITRLAYRSFLYPAPRRGLERAPDGGELLSFQAADGQTAQALWLPASPDAPALVHFHGNGETIADSVSLGRELVRGGLSFLAVEYRGYGSSPADEGPSEEGLYADAEGALAMLVQRGVSPERIVLWGTSLGSGVALEMAVRGHGSRLILVTPYTSIPDVAARVVPFLPARWLIGDRFDNLAKAARVRVPTLVLHGDHDALVPYDMGLALARAIDGAELITVAGGGHNDLFARERERLLSAVARHALSALAGAAR